MLVQYAAAYVATLVVFLALDAVWLGTMANLLYKPTLGDILLPKFSPAPAAIFYLVFIVGILIFAVVPAMRTGNGRPPRSTGPCSASSPTGSTTSQTWRRCATGR